MVVSKTRTARAAVAVPMAEAMGQLWWSRSRWSLTPQQQCEVFSAYSVGEEDIIVMSCTWMPGSREGTVCGECIEGYRTP